MNATTATLPTPPLAVPAWCTLHREFEGDFAIGGGPADLSHVDGADVSVRPEWDEANGTTVSLSRTVGEETTYLDGLTIGQATHLSEALQRVLAAIADEPPHPGQQP